MIVPSIVLIVAIWILLCCRKTSAFGCLNHNNEFVDWWVMYKRSGGLDYVYYDSLLFQSDSKNQELSPSRRITDSDSPLVNTIRSSNFPNIDDSNKSFLTWNDHVPGAKSTYSDGGHAKGFLGMNNNTNLGTVESFFIQHSLPRFPAFKSSDYFDTNVNKRAQHFVCVSMNDSVSTRIKKDDEKEKEKKNLDVEAHNFTKIIFKYVTHIQAHILFRDSYSYGQQSPFKNNYFANIFNEMLKSKPKEDVTSFSITSTGLKDSQLKFQIIAKSPHSSLDIYDDVTSLLSIHHEDYNINERAIPKRKHKKSMLMICQSHIDPSILGINNKLLETRKGLNASVSILNSSSVQLPFKRAGQLLPEYFMQHSMYLDHSKWSIATPYGESGQFIAKFCFYDLNRTTKQTKRGGAAFCLNTSLTGSTKASHAIWSMFLAFKPVPTNMARFNDADIKTVLRQIVPKIEDPPEAEIDDFNAELDYEADFETCKRKRSASEVTITSSFNNLGITEDAESPIASTNTVSQVRVLRSRSKSDLSISPVFISRKKSRKSVASKIQNSEANDDDLPSLEFDTSNNAILVNYLGKIETLPCPYKFNTDRPSVKKPLHSHTQSAIQRAIDRSGVSEINIFLQTLGLRIVNSSDSSKVSTQTIETPFQKASLHLFTPSTIFVAGDGRKENQNLDLENEVVDETTSRLVYAHNEDSYSDSESQIIFDNIDSDSENINIYHDCNLNTSSNTNEQPSTATVPNRRLFGT